MKQSNYFFSLFFILIGNMAFSQEAKTDSVIVENKEDLQNNSHFRYYYYPNLEIYYDLQDDIYICKVKDQWVKKNQLSTNSKGYSMSNNVYVLIKGYVGNTPYEYIEQHKKDFPANFKSRKQTKVIVKQ